ncbi:probable maltase [Mercenaria mercenaria]|uniref:probable maltase n=1 Tax=Mercenaria mercenaria TaxID=6596 RepID=UPI00234ECDE1|nr:probable maltase [Mercenaria mercenaria]
MSNENSNHPEEKRSLKDGFDDSATPDDIDDSKVKFLNGKSGLDDECVVEVGSDVSFTGLGKDELMKYANDPFWVRTRMILFAAFWIGWIAMLAAAIVIIIVAPKCPERPSQTWYQTDVVYQINVKSYKDSQKEGVDGAGVGDLGGIASKIEYLQSIGVNAFWLNSFYKSGDNSYDNNDVVDHKQVDESVGTMQVFDSLRKDTKKKGMRMILDFIPNHTGKKHEWFLKSEAKEAGFENFYIWAAGTGSDPTVNPPNNWVTAYGSPAWTYSTARKEWYYHSYLPEYPDLNLRDEDVLSNVDGILKFWLDKGVDGFAVQGLQRLVESNDTSMDEGSVGEHTVDQPENQELVKRWRGIINSYSDKPGRERTLIAKIVEKGNNTAEYYKAGIHILISDALVNVDPLTCDQQCMKNKLMSANEDGLWRGWQLDNENSSRFGSVVSEDLQKAWQAFHLLLPGTAFVYYGDEIAMKNGVVGASDTKDPLARVSGQTSRDPYRTPMLWSTGDNAGFCAKNVTPWLPINADYMNNNVEFNRAHLVGYTVLNSFEDLVKLRSKESLQFGKFEMKIFNDILYFTRKAEGFPGYLVAINRGAKTAGFSDVADKLTLLYDSAGTDNVGTVLDTKAAPIGFTDGEVYVFEY